MVSADRAQRQAASGRSAHVLRHHQGSVIVRHIVPLPGCADLKLILQQQRFAGPRPRTIAPTAADIEAVRKAAHDLDYASAALAYALQFEGGMRQWDVIGKWVPLSYKAPSSIIDQGKKWIGPMWSQIDQNMILRYTPAKTQFTSGAQVTLDLRECPMVLAELGEDTGRGAPRSADRQSAHRLSVSAEHLSRLVERVAKAAGIPDGLWSRDLRAGAATEGGRPAPDRRHGQAGSAIPISAPRPKSTTAIASKRIAVSPARASPTGTKTEAEHERVQRACSDAHASTRSRA